MASVVADRGIHAGEAAIRRSGAVAMPARPLRVAIVHYWLVGLGGGEKVVQEILQIYPQADVFTLIDDPSFSREFLPGTKITTSFLQHIPFAKKLHRKLLPLMPAALENLDLSGYDLIISSESGPAKGVMPPLGAVHVCYCHSPMRYVWDQYHEYMREAGLLARIVLRSVVARLRVWDFATSMRVDRFAANSNHIARRIGQFYRRDATVIHPPVDISAFAPAPRKSDYYLITGRHVGYKRIDLAIAACEKLGRKLVITGAGPDTDRLRKLAGPNTTFVGQCSFQDLARYYGEARAFLMPGQEDFGIAPVEAMASGTPVIAYAYGGALDTVVPGISGLLFDDQSQESLAAAITRFEACESDFDPDAIAAHAQSFGRDVFRSRFAAFVEEALAEGRPPTLSRIA
jgi:glycosyltransferase involved in cell wall biosynthesis